jgi:hypothetical protein
MTYSPHAFQIAVLGTSQIGKFISTHGTTGDIIIPDDDKFSFGTGSDASIYFDATNLVIADENIPVQIGHASNTTTIVGNLTVNGTTTTINSTTMTVDDLNLVLASGAADSSAANGAGITIDGASATLLYTHATTSWDMNKPLNVTGAGTFSGILKTDDTTDATSKTDGSLQTDGGLSVAKAIYNGTAATFAADSGIVTIGSATAATFSAAGLLNINNATDATSATDGSLQTDGGLSVVKDCIFGNDVKLLTDSAVFSMGVGSDFTITHDGSTGATIATGATGLAINTDTITVSSANSTDPVMILKNTNTDANAARLRFVKDAGEAGADGDDIGVIEFYGDDAAQTQTVFAKIVAEVSEADDTDEAGKLSFYVAESDGTTTALAAGLVLEGEHATDGEVDVTIGAGTASTTTIAGDLKVTTDIILDDGGSLKEAGGVAAITFDGSANVTKIGLDTPSDGQVLTWTTSGTARAVWSPVIASGLASDDLTVGDAAVTLSTSSGNITIETQSSDTDIIFNVDDGGSQITALTLDGSDDGAAIFKSTIKGTVFKPAVEVVSSAGVTVSKGYTAITTAGVNRTATMPEATAALVGSTYTIKKVDSGAGNVSVTAEGDGLIDGGASVVLYHQFESVTVICRAADVWDIM